MRVVHEEVGSGRAFVENLPESTLGAILHLRVELLLTLLVVECRVDVIHPHALLGERLVVGFLLLALGFSIRVGLLLRFSVTFCKDGVHLALREVVDELVVVRELIAGLWRVVRVEFLLDLGESRLEFGVLLVARCKFVGVLLVVLVELPAERILGTLHRVVGDFLLRLRFGFALVLGLVIGRLGRFFGLFGFFRLFLGLFFRGFGRLFHLGFFRLRLGRFRFFGFLRGKFRESLV